jgi:ABC-type multidrug transport system fused ATPase/permease subunit
LTNVGSLGGAAAAISVGALEVAAGRLSVPALFVILMLPFAFFRPFSELSYYWHVGVNGLSASKRIGQLLSQTPEVVERAVPPSPSATMTRAPNLSFDRVTFAYSLGERPALRDFSLLVAPGETVAIVGPSGAGKSTAVALLLRFFDPLSGRILLDGRDLRAWPLAEVRRAISVVSQDAYLFHGTIADNIRLARPGATDAEVHAAARAANIHGFVSSLPGGYETLVAERGTTLSGGQRQRVAIARALLKDAPVLVLDEPTSNVDSASEAAIQDSLEGLADGRTTLIIAHRISTVRGADRIVVLSEGRVAESGKHTDLLRHQGDYARLVAAQGRA